ncbi:MAG: 1,2-phenylacetyl-CoA epoxidase subunit PaaC [Halobacteriales archaeon]
MPVSGLGDPERAAVEAFLFGIADDEFVHGERLKQWLTVAPTLEEDNVLTSIAQDELGHARLWYELLAESGQGTLDELAIDRSAADRRNTVLVEPEHADFADTVIRMLCYDTAEQLLLEALAESEFQPISERATVADQEETFHREHSDRWQSVMEHAQPGEGQERLRRAVRDNLRHCGDLFAFESPELLARSGVIGSSLEELEREWQATVLPALSSLPVEMTIDELSGLIDEDSLNGRHGHHTHEFGPFVESFQPREHERLEV